MAIFVLPKWAKFTQLIKHWKLYQEFLARTHIFTRQSLESQAHQEVNHINPTSPKVFGGVYSPPGECAMRGGGGVQLGACEGPVFPGLFICAILIW
jgi:hypothetical protein